MDNQPTISVIIPVYNSDRFVAQAIHSILAQTLPPTEIIVVDDGSTDDTAAVVAGLIPAAAVPIRYVYQDNQGPAAARNRGIALATGDLVAFLDADDLWLPDKLRLQVAHLAAAPAADGVICHAEFFVEPGYNWPADRRNRDDYDQCPPMYSFCTLLIRRAALARAGLLDTAYRTAEDTEWFARARDLGVTLDVTPAVLLRRRFHDRNISSVPEGANQRLLQVVRAALRRRQNG